MLNEKTLIIYKGLTIYKGLQHSFENYQKPFLKYFYVFQPKTEEEKFAPIFVAKLFGEGMNEKVALFTMVIIPIHHLLLDDSG